MDGSPDGKHKPDDCTDPTAPSARPTPVCCYGSKTEEWVSSPLVAEGLAVREALYQAREHGFNSLILKLDAQILIRAINGRDSIKGLFEILQDVQSLTCYLSDFSFSHVPRSNNTAADLLANRALSDLYSA
ncbi:hypothetical protein HID58_094012 [Brassica napus]|uniref:RNase H type-1 domain-containing protein n=1 Tax=Brassica napus TaxID=3708 RepID=A0ABQ7X919_BRANA|nr:hypothetical protein HID58_094012 [Brassica napus]